MLSSSELDHIVIIRIQLLNSRGPTLIEFRTNAQLAMSIETPGENLLFVIDVEAVLVSTENVNRIFGATFLDF